tara:strand:+ start:766 stop:1239 length:474 start_codon:yes stop_codon:yes gene_type:complete
MGYTVDKAEIKDCLELAPKMRESDKQEIWSSGRFTPSGALYESLQVSSEHAYSLKLDEEVVGIFGVAPCDDQLDIGVVWLMGSDNMTTNKKGFYKISQEYLKKFLKLYKTVFNYVDERNIGSSKWLESLGFKKLYREPEFGVDKIPFNLYIKDRTNV